MIAVERRILTPITSQVWTQLQGGLVSYSRTLLTCEQKFMNFLMHRIGDVIEFSTADGTEWSAARLYPTLRYVISSVSEIAGPLSEELLLVEVKRPLRFKLSHARLADKAVLNVNRRLPVEMICNVQRTTNRRGSSQAAFSL